MEKSFQLHCLQLVLLNYYTPTSWFEVNLFNVVFARTNHCYEGTCLLPPPDFALGLEEQVGERPMFRGQDGSQGRKRLAGPQLQASRSVSSSLSTVADRESYCFSCWAVTERNCSVLSLCYQKLCLKKKNQHRGGDWVLRAHLSCCTPSCDPGPPNCP